MYILPGHSSRASPRRESSSSRRASSERGSPYTKRSRESSPQRTPYSGKGDDSTFVADQSQREEDLRKEIYLLQGQLSASRDLNDALKKELSLYDTLSRNSKSGQKSGGLLGTSGVGNQGELSLREHLEEIRALRLRLEDSIQQNNKLRELLEKQLANAGLDQG